MGKLILDDLGGENVTRNNPSKGKSKAGESENMTKRVE